MALGCYRSAFLRVCCTSVLLHGSDLSALPSHSSFLIPVVNSFAALCVRLCVCVAECGSCPL